MNVLLDEDVPVGLAQYLTGHRVDSVNFIGWKGTKNGDLLTRAVDAGYGVLLVVDKRMPDQQNLLRFDIAVVLLHPYNERKKLGDLLPLVPALLEALDSAPKRQVTQGSRLRPVDEPRRGVDPEECPLLPVHPPLRVGFDRGAVALQADRAPDPFVWCQ